MIQLFSRIPVQCIRQSLDKREILKKTKKTNESLFFWFFSETDVIILFRLYWNADCCFDGILPGRHST